MRDLTFQELREANGNRRTEQRFLHGANDWTPAQWFQALVGEIGEYANFRKKFERGDFDEEFFLKEARKELADVQVYLDLLASTLGIDLASAVVDKFNEVSDRYGSEIKL